MSELTDIAYAAGIIDGEGCISISRVWSSRYPAWNGRIVVDMTESPVPGWLGETFGGRVRPEAKPERRSRTIWTKTGREAVEFLKLIRPYLKDKAPQADVFMAFYSDPQIIFKRTHPGHGVTATQIGLRDSSVNRLSALKGPGKSGRPRRVAA